MPQNITDVDVFTDPIVAPADGDALDAASALVGLQGLSNRTRNIDSRFDADGQIILPVSKIFQRYRAALSCDDPGSWNQNNSGLPGAGNNLSSTVNGDKAWFDVTESIPRQSDVVRVSALVTPGIARTPANRMAIEMYVVDYGLATSPVVTATLLAAGDATATGHVSDDGTINAQWLTLDFTGTPMPGSDFDAWTVSVIAGNDAATNVDLIHAVLVEFQTDLLGND